MENRCLRNVGLSLRNGANAPHYFSCKIFIFITILFLYSFSCKSSQNDKIQAADNAVANISHIPDIRIDSMVVNVTSLWDNSEIANIKIEPDSTVWSYVEYLPPYKSVKRTRTVRLDDSVGDRIVKLVEDMFIKKQSL